MSTKLPPPPRQITPKGTPPGRMETKQNMRKPEPGNLSALNFRVPEEFKRDFKIASAMAGITQSELLQQAFKRWIEKN